MKKLSVVTKVCLLIFALFVLLALVFAKPLYDRMETAIDSYVKTLQTVVTEKTGLSISYESFSPSILTGLKIENIVLKDKQGNTVLVVKNTKVKYSIVEILKGNYKGFIRAGTVDGVDIRISPLIEVLKPFAKKEKKDFNITQITDFIPANVAIKNISVIYEDEILSANVGIKNISLASPEGKKSFEFQMDSIAAVNLVNQGINLKGNIAASGVLYTALDNSQITLNLSDLTDGNYKIGKTNLFVTYKDNKVEAHTIQMVYPFSIGVAYDIKNNIASAELKTDNLNPVTVVSLNQSSKIMDLIKNLRLSLDAAVDYNLNEKQVSYKANGNVVVPPTLIPEGSVVDFSVSGDDKSVSVNNLSLAGPLCDATLAASMDFGTLSVSGSCDVKKFHLPNGNNVKTSLAFEPMSSGMKLYSSEISIGEHSLTGLIAKVHPGNGSVDFELEVSDSSQKNGNIPGKISMEGSYLTESNYLQTSLSVASVYIRNLINFAGEVVPADLEKQIASVHNYIEPYMFSCDAYLSTDFKSVLYNVTNLVVADTSADNRIVFVSLNGNERSVQLNHFDFIYDKLAMNLSGSVDMDYEEKEVFFTADITSSKVPYSFMGTINPKVVKITGDYGIDAELHLDGLSEDRLDGFVNVGNLPFAFGDYAMIVSMETQFDYTKMYGPSLVIKRFEIEETDSRSTLNPKMVVSGNMTKYGAQFNSISYSDAYSSLQGNSDITVNMNGLNFESAGILLNLKNVISDEQIDMEFSISNPEGLPLNLETLKNDIYVNMFIQINHFGLNRFMGSKNNDNEITATLSLSGTFNHPFAIVNIPQMSFLLGDKLLHARGAATFEDWDITVNEFNIDYPGWNVQDFGGSISLQTLTGDLKCLFNMGEGVMSMPLNIRIADSYVPEGSFMPENLAVEISSDKISGAILKKPLAFSFTALYTPDEISFYSSENLGLYGSYLMSVGELYGFMKSGDAAYAEFQGMMEGKGVNLYLNNLLVNLKSVVEMFDLKDFVKVNSGTLQGNLSLSGRFDDPEFGGELYIVEPQVEIPSVFLDKFSSDMITISANHNEITLQKSSYMIKNIPRLEVEGKITLNKWVLDQMKFSVQTLKNQFIPLSFTSPWVNVYGELTCNADMSFDGKNMEVSGSVFGENMNVVSYLQDITSAEPVNTSSSKKKTADFNIRTDVQLILGTHVMINFNPLLRCIFAPNTKVGLKIDTSTNSFQVDGQLNLKSGDISYLNRNFYVKNGSIKLNPDDLINPLITIQAETREKDDYGQTVRIMLNAENQHLLDFNPKFSSDPAKSEAEIRSILGQIVLGDSDSISSLIFTAGDYYLQSTVMRGMENKLRDLLNFDIFSIRTNLVQNTINGVSGVLSKEKAGNNLLLGNFLDNSTVYMGKYLESDLYIDAMMHLSMENGNFSTGGLLFQPEFGMELELPVVNIRWSMAPDINSLMNHQYVPSTAVSLSWKFSF